MGGIRWVGGPLMAVAMGLAASATGAETLSVGYGRDDAPPLAFAYRDRLVGGMIKNVGDAVGKALEVRGEYRLVPRKREEQSLDKGRVDIMCFSTPKWLKDTGGFGWTVPVYDDAVGVAVRIGDAARTTSAADLAGRTVGTIGGYYYNGPLGALLRDKKAIRKDAVDPLENLDRLRAGEVDAVLVNHIKLGFLIRELGMAGEVAVVFDDGPPAALRCAVSNKASPEPAKIIEAFETLKAAGRFDAIRARY